jgi:hypothetical protein
MEVLLGRAHDDRPAAVAVEVLVPLAARVVVPVVVPVVGLGDVDVDDRDLDPDRGEARPGDAHVPRWGGDLPHRRQRVAARAAHARGPGGVDEDGGALLEHRLHGDRAAAGELVVRHAQVAAQHHGRELGDVGRYLVHGDGAPTAPPQSRVRVERGHPRLRLSGVRCQVRDEGVGVAPADVAGAGRSRWGGCRGQWEERVGSRGVELLQEHRDLRRRGHGLAGADHGADQDARAERDRDQHDDGGSGGADPVRADGPRAHPGTALAAVDAPRAGAPRADDESESQ